MNSFLLAVGIFLQIYGGAAFIIPDEIPSLLSVVYSNIPIIKKGTDSRIGWGFRLGDRADFQVLVELGPQKYTQPLANEPNKVVSNKRSALNDLASELWAQRQEDKRRAQEIRESEQTESTNTKAGSWLQTWSNGMKNRRPTVIPEIPQIHEDEIKPGLGIGEIDAKLVIPEDDSSALKTLYSRNEVISETESSSLTTSTTAALTTRSLSSLPITTKKEGIENNVE